MNKPLIFATLISTIGLPVHAEETTGPNFGGLLEVTMTADNLALAKAELLLNQPINPFVTADLSLLYEGDTTDVDVATISMGGAESPWSLTTGQYYIPFGSFETYMVSDPLTMDLAKTRAQALQVGYGAKGFAVTAYIVSGTASLDTQGYNLSYHYEGADTHFTLIAGGTSDLSKAVNIDATDAVAGQSLSAILNLGGMSLIYENISAATAFTTGLTMTGQMPSATNIELGYEFTLAGKDSVIALANQTSTGADQLLAKNRNMLVVGSEIVEQTYLSLEFSQETDYSAAVSEAITLKLAAEF